MGAWNGANADKISRDLKVSFMERSELREAFRAALRGALMQSLCLVVDAEPSVPGLGHQPGELRLVHVDERRVIPAFEIDVGLRLDAVVNDDIQFVSPANRGNRAR